MTLLQWLRWTHPDHCQRIAEETWRQDPRNAAAVLEGPPGTYPIAGCFCWSRSPEGHDYWARLSREPFGDPDAKKVRKKYKSQKDKPMAHMVRSWSRT